MKDTYKYEVAISFAKEDRNAALALVLALEIEGFKNIYYYHDQPAATAASRLIPALRKIFSEEARYIVVLLSKKYFKNNSPAIRAEFNAICERIESSTDTLNVILVKLKRDLDFSEYASLQEITYAEWDFNPKKVAGILKSKFGTTEHLQDKKKGGASKTEQKTVFSQRNNSSVSKNQKNKLSIKF
jgi:hypothetical protein